MDPKNEPYIENNLEELRTTGKTTMIWSCRSHKAVRPGDKAFLAKVGSEGRGIFGSGKVISEAFLFQHWSGEGRDVPRVRIEFDFLLHPNKGPLLKTENIGKELLIEQVWTPQASGISIKREIVEELEEKWFNFLISQNLGYNPFTETLESERYYKEGAASQTIQTRYERNPQARKICLGYHQHSCKVCGFNFEETYGEIGREFIHVHHLVGLAVIKQEYQINPIKDLRPVCPNCHAMLHKKNPPFTIEELQRILKRDI